MKVDQVPASNGDHRQIWQFQFQALFSSKCLVTIRRLLKLNSGQAWSLVDRWRSAQSRPQHGACSQGRTEFPAPRRRHRPTGRAARRAGSSRWSGSARASARRSTKCGSAHGNDQHQNRSAAQTPYRHPSDAGRFKPGEHSPRGERRDAVSKNRYSLRCGRSGSVGRSSAAGARGRGAGSGAAGSTGVR